MFAFLAIVTLLVAGLLFFSRKVKNKYISYFLILFSCLVGFYAIWLIFSAVTSGEM